MSSAAVPATTETGLITAFHKFQPVNQWGLWLAFSADKLNSGFLWGVISDNIDMQLKQQKETSVDSPSANYMYQHKICTVSWCNYQNTW